MTDDPTRWGDPDCVVLDIGESTGALVVAADPQVEGREIEISPRTAPERRTHAALRGRRVSRGRVVAACFPSLAAGEYLVWPVGGGAPTPVEVVGGEVVTVEIGIVELGVVPASHQRVHS